MAIWQCLSCGDVSHWLIRTVTVLIFPFFFFLYCETHNLILLLCFNFCACHNRINLVSPLSHTWNHLFLLLLHHDIRSGPSILLILIYHILRLLPTRAAYSIPTCIEKCCVLAPPLLVLCLHATLQSSHHTSDISVVTAIVPLTNVWLRMDGWDARIFLVI